VPSTRARAKKSDHKIKLPYKPLSENNNMEDDLQGYLSEGEVRVD